MAYDKEEIEILRDELGKLLGCLDNIAASENQRCEDRLKPLEERNRQLQIELSQVKSENEELRKQEISQIQLERGNFERKLSQIRFEHELLLQTLESVKTEKENLRETNQKLVLDNEALKSRLEEIQEVSYRQSDKIIALRSVAKALESENELLSKDKGRQTRGKDENGGIQDTIFLRFRLGELESELNAKEEERRGFMMCFENLESEKTILSKKLSQIEQDVEEIRKERDELRTSLVLSNDTLDALRQSKRLVENKFQNVVEISERQARDLQSLSDEKMLLEEQLSQRTANLEAIQQELELQATVYESTINGMQSELDKRLDEITASKDEDAEVIRKQFVELFDEKAREMNRVEAEYSECKLKLEAANRRLVDCDYKEQELTDLLHRKNSFVESGRQVGDQVEALTRQSEDLEDRLGRMKLQYEELQTSYMTAVAHFKARIIQESQEQIPTTPPSSQQQQLWNCDINCNNNNNNEKLSSSTKKRRKTGKKAKN